MYSITEPSSVNLITPDMEAISASPESLFIRERWNIVRENVHKRVVSPQSYQLLANMRVLNTSSKVNKPVPAFHIKVLSYKSSYTHRPDLTRHNQTKAMLKEKKERNL